MSPLTPEDLEGGAQQLLLRAGASAPGDTATVAALIGRVHHRGRIRRRRRRLVRSAVGVGATAAVVLVALALPGSDDTRSLEPAGPSTTATSPDDFTAGGWTLPRETHLPDGLKDWRGQIRESMRRYPDAFVVPERLPSDIFEMHVAVHGEQPLIGVDTDGPGVFICVADLATCQQGFTDWPVVRSGEVDSRSFHVLVSPPGKPDETGLTTSEREFWATVPFTAGTPDWMAATDIRP
ncbi:hypothetical protein CLV92_111134 [Kineococcus xinjiangensis]|uniref:Uncharacterized protein n=1 Tax=Kineococcus xinjiangensis TaxID=512762 RepID=A0A2S6IGA4_9ACTN|nr:hypothetical protein [Kineococcus xinjiangensis]PPK93217.1 hypothetical protein CLV92_111134 [Kineococcus xinjiangensis]